MKEEPTTRLRCRPGDLAIVTRCKVRERIGLLVRVIERRAGQDYDWLTELLGESVMAWDIHTGAYRQCRHSLVQDSSLTPIRGLESPYGTSHYSDEPYCERPSTFR